MHGLWRLGQLSHLLILGIEEDELRTLIENGPPPFLVKEYSRLEKLAEITRAKCDKLREEYGFPAFRPGYYEICEEHRFGGPTTRQGQRNPDAYARCNACKWIPQVRGKSDGDSPWEPNKPSAAARGLATPEWNWESEARVSDGRCKQKSCKSTDKNARTFGMKDVAICGFYVARDVEVHGEQAIVVAESWRDEVCIACNESALQRLFGKMVTVTLRDGAGERIAEASDKFQSPEKPAADHGSRKKRPPAAAEGQVKKCKVKPLKRQNPGGEETGAGTRDAKRQQATLTADGKGLQQRG